MPARRSGRPAIARLRLRDQVTVGHLRELVAKISGGDVVPLVARLLSQRTLSGEQIARLTELLEQARKKSEAARTQRRKS